MIIEEEDSDDDVEVDDEELDDVDSLATKVYIEGKQPFDEDMPYVDEEDRHYWEGLLSENENLFDVHLLDMQPTGGNVNIQVGAGCTSNLLQLVGVTTNNVNMEIPAKIDVSECMESDDEIGSGKPNYEEFIESRDMAKPHICLGMLVVVVCKKKRCKYKVYASNVKGEKSFQIKQMYLKHSCARSYKNTQVTSQWLANKYLETIRVNPKWLLKAFKYQVMNDFKVDVTKYKVYRAKRKAFEIIHGDYEESYGRLWDYAATLQKTNKGSCVVVKVVKTIPTSPIIFQRMYVSFAVMKKGFKEGCRPFIGLDGCHLKGPYRGQLLSAIGRDGNDNIYPIAVTTVEQENNEAWSWFLKNLLDDIGSVKDNGWTFISDRQKEVFKKFMPTGRSQNMCAPFVCKLLRQRAQKEGIEGKVMGSSCYMHRNRVFSCNGGA
uniref:MULE transposase domain-containing protein n=1 Tax=Fagus sylvatica TaxID=28930 RepID=A0A2N9FC16_FAGSY